MKGEVRFIRAYEYFERSQLYGDFPLVTKMLTTTEANDVQRSPKAEVVQFILNELDTIAPPCQPPMRQAITVALPRELPWL